MQQANKKTNKQADKQTNIGKAMAIIIIIT